jgi:uridine kinase
LLFDGVFLLRPELEGCWDLSVFLQVDPATSLERVLKRDLRLFGTRDAIERRYCERYLPGQQLYVSLVHPERLAEILIDNNDPAAPRLLHIPPG